MNNDRFSTDATAQFVLSYELLALLRWLVENGQDDLEALVHQAIGAGLDKELKNKRHGGESQEEALEEMQQGIVDFFTALEVFMLEAMHKQMKQRARENDLLATVDQIDMNLYDTVTVETSLEKAASAIERKPTADPKELLFRELLRRWRPNKKSASN
jgi:hypothetical protein